jgi:hypothetical protein
MHLNDASLIGKEAGAAGDAAIAGPTSNAAMQTTILEMPDTADWIVIMVNPRMLLIENTLARRYYKAVSIGATPLRDNHGQRAIRSRNARNHQQGY